MAEKSPSLLQLTIASGCEPLPPRVTYEGGGGGEERAAGEANDVFLTKDYSATSLRAAGPCVGTYR